MFRQTPVQWLETSYGGFLDKTFRDKQDGCIKVVLRP